MVQHIDLIDTFTLSVHESGAIRSQSIDQTNSKHRTCVRYVLANHLY